MILYKNIQKDILTTKLVAVRVTQNARNKERKAREVRIIGV